MDNPVRFSDDVRDKVDERTRSMMAIYERSTAHLWSAVDQQTHHFLVSGSDDIRGLHNNYVNAIVASAAAKHVSLRIGLIEAVNKYDFLGYALAARSVVELVATLRYLLVNKLHPIIKEMTSGQYTAAQVQRLIKEEDIFLRGTRFDWLEFFEKGFRPLNERYAEWLIEKRKNKDAPKWKPDRPAPVQQFSVSTCIGKWAESEPGIGVLYDLLCDMVHPNIGSVISTMVSRRDEIRFRVRDPSSEGFRLFQHSFPAWLALTGDEHSRLFEALVNLFLPTEPNALRQSGMRASV